MQVIESNLMTKDQINLYILENKVDQPKAQILEVHGYTEHLGRHDKITKIYNDLGLNVIRYDQRGYGRSEGRRAYVHRFTDYINDLESVINQKTDPQLPLILSGCSMGGLIIARYLIDKGEGKVGAAILFSPALKISDEVSPLLRKISGIMSVIFPKLRTIKLDSSALSRNPEVVKSYLNDPLVYHGGTYARTGAEMIKTTSYVQNLYHKVTVPILLLHGSADTLTDPQGSQWMYDKISSIDKEIHIFDGLYHELLNEPEHLQVEEVLKNWLSNEERILKMSHQAEIA